MSEDAQSQTLPPEFTDRVTRYLDGDRSPECLRILNGELAASAACRDAFVRLCLVESLLTEELTSAGRNSLLRDTEPLEAGLGDAMIAPAIRESESESEPIASATRRGHVAPAEQGAHAAPRVGGHFRYKIPLNWKMVAGILLPLGITLAILWRAWTAPVAVLAATVDAEWDAPSGSLHAGAALPRGPISLKAGLAKIMLNNGVSIVVQAPARFQVGSDNSATLDLGKLTAVVPANAHGFAVHTSRATITDLGTEFGVEVSADQITHAEVFKGQVQVALTLNAGQTTTAGTRLLGQSQAVEIAPDAASMDIATASPLSFVREEQLASLPANGTVSRHDRWVAFSRQLSRDPALVAYYTFDNESESPNRLLNRAEATLGTSDGVIENAAWDEGRLPGKRALRFNGADSRVSVDIPGSFERITLSTWVQLDQVNQPIIAMLDSDGWSSPGQLHWQMGDYGFWIGCYPDSQNPILSFMPSGTLSGRWLHLVATIDATTGVGVLYCNGVEVQRKMRQWSRPLSIGSAQIGSFNPRGAVSFGTELQRMLLGRLDEIAVFNRVLSAREIKALYESGTTIETH